MVSNSKQQECRIFRPMGVGSLKLSLTIVFFVFVQILSAQSFIVSGRVIDSLSKQPLAFVSVVVNDSRQGGLSDIDGYFNVRSNEKPRYLRVSYLGYKNDSILLRGKNTGLEILLAPTHYELSGVQILPGENPALRIVRQVIINSDRHNPEKYPTFAYRSYNKITAEWYPNEKYFSALERMQSDSNALDSSLIRLVGSTDKQHLMMLESYTRRIFMYPARSNEIVLATRVSGFSDPDFAPLATDLQPFSFYKDIIDLNTGTVTGYQNPFGNGGIPRYIYLLEDTLYDGNDSIYVISFRPRQGKSFNALQGVAYIHTRGYALQNIIAEPVESVLWKIKVQQQYCLVNDSLWFPEQLNYDWILPKYPNDKLGLLLKGRSYIDSVEIGLTLKASDFGPDKVDLADRAGRRDSLYWASHRRDSLDLKETRTYAVMDSLGRKYKLDYYTRAVPALLDGYIPIGPVDLAFDKLYTFNEYEGHRVGLGLRTGDKLLKWMHIGGYFGYGFRDKEYKYGGEAWFRLWKKHDLALQFNYSKDLVEPGLSTLAGNGSNYWFGMIGNRFDFTEEYSGRFRFRSLRFLQTEFSFRHSVVSPCYDYVFLPEGPGSVINPVEPVFTLTEASISLHYTFRDELTQAFGRRLSTGSRYPEIFLSYTRGFKGILDGGSEYNKLEAAVSQVFRIRNFGRMSLLTEAGIMDPNVPYPRLFRGRGSYGGDLSFLLLNSFQTMRTGEFAGTRYVNFFFSHNFGNFLFKAGKFKPEFILVHNLMFGRLDQADHHDLLDFQAPSKGFYEAGLVIDNLIRFKLLNIAYLGIGGGAFYRYGAYQFDNTLKNFAFKISFRISGN